jgi:hypothetical protein
MVVIPIPSPFGFPDAEQSFSVAAATGPSILMPLRVVSAVVQLESKMFAVELPVAYSPWPVVTLLAVLLDATIVFVAIKLIASSPEFVWTCDSVTVTS